MPSRWSLLLVCALLTGCVTTQESTTNPNAGVTPPANDLPSDHTLAADTAPAWPSDGEMVPAAIEYDNVWQRVVDDFRIEGCDAHEISRDWAAWYGSRPEYMARVMQRAEPWAFYIVSELENRGMPGELALLPIVESAYDPFAYSHGNASGMWQFISSTGRNYGLQQDWWYDGRRDVWSSTQAALDYLEFLHDKFDGDWLLALAAYNSGEGRVARRIADNERRGKPADFWHLSLPRETRGYVPKMMGLACLFRDPAKYGWELPHTENLPVVAAVELPGQADLVLVSQMADVDIVELYHLNPGFNRWATSPKGPHLVVLPIEEANRVAPDLQRLNPDSLMKWDEVTVQRGDTLSGLSNRHAVPVATIRSANGLNGDLIREGQKLRLPRGNELVADPLYAAAALELADLQRGLAVTDRINHRVRSGESLSVIARRYRVSTRELQRWNNISNPDRLRVGQTLVVFREGVPAYQQSGTMVHTVRSGDSLWSISRKYDVSLQDLMRWNGLGSQSVLQPGQTIKIAN